jgi:PTS system N-acetylglucosamine-specific IIC component
MKIPVDQVPAAFSKLNNQFIGIVSGLIGAACYNRFCKVKLPDMLSFFSGRRCVAIVTAGVTLVFVLVLAFLWPVVFGGLVKFGELIVKAGPVGAGIYGFLNRLLIPVGLHHALNSVFWFDVAGINDIGKFWSATAGGIKGQTGMYMTGFFPVMMFGLPAACLAMVHCAKTTKKKVAAGLLLSSALAAFFVGITEPIEFAFMFLAPGLYLVHAILTGISLFVCAMLPVRCGFNFSAGFVDWFLSFKAPMAENPLLILPIGVVYAVIYYVVFRFLITKFNLKTPGREDDDDVEADSALKNARGDAKFMEMARICIEGLGGPANILSVEYCATRLRTEVKDMALVNDAKLKSSGARGVIRPGKTSVQVVIGPTVQFVADEVKRQLAGGEVANFIELCAPVPGEVKPLKESADPTHSGEVLGKGAIFIPTDGKIYAPVDGEISMVFDTLHALNITTDSGVEILVHCGIDTVKLGGKGFKPHVAEGDKVKKGDLLLEYDENVIKEAGFSIETQMVVTNTDDYKSITLEKTGPCAAGDAVVKVVY